MHSPPYHVLLSGYWLMAAAGRITLKIFRVTQRASRFSWNRSRHHPLQRVNNGREKTFSTCWWISPTRIISIQQRWSDDLVAGGFSPIGKTFFSSPTDRISTQRNSTEQHYVRDLMLRRVITYGRPYNLFCSESRTSWTARQYQWRFWIELNGPVPPHLLFFYMRNLFNWKLYRQRYIFAVEASITFVWLFLQRSENSSKSICERQYLAKQKAAGLAYILKIGSSSWKSLWCGGQSNQTQIAGEGRRRRRRRKVAAQ